MSSGSLDKITNEAMCWLASLYIY